MVCAPRPCPAKPTRRRDPRAEHGADLRRAGLRSPELSQTARIRGPRRQRRRIPELDRCVDRPLCGHPHPPLVPTRLAPVRAFPDGHTLVSVRAPSAESTFAKDRLPPVFPPRGASALCSDGYPSRRLGVFPRRTLWNPPARHTALAPRARPDSFIGRGELNPEAHASRSQPIHTGIADAGMIQGPISAPSP